MPLHRALATWVLVALIEPSCCSEPSTAPPAPTATLLSVLPSYGRAEPKLFGVNWEGVVKGTSYLNITATGVHGVPSWLNRQRPLLSPKLVKGLRMLRARSLRFPGGAPSNYWNWSNSSFVPPELCNDKLGPGGCAVYWPTQLAANQNLPRDALSWASFAALLQAVNATGMWCIDVVNSSPQEAAKALAALQSADFGEQLEVELGNEVYDFHAFLPIFPNASTYLRWVAPLLAARASETQMSVPVPPCPSFYNEACWGGPETLLAAWYDNISSAAKRTAFEARRPSTPGTFGAVTAHHYRPTVKEINCTLTGGCMYDAANTDGVGISKDKAVSKQLNLTVQDFASVMISYPSVTLSAAARAWRVDFPGRKLLITEFEMQWPNYSPPLDSSPVGQFVHSAVNSGAHACFYAAAVVAGLDSGGVIGSINHHALGAGEPGWGLMDLSSSAGVGFNAVAQMMSHLSALATESHTAAHRVNVSGGATLGSLVVDSVKDLPALQAAALSAVDRTSLVLLVVNRAKAAVTSTVALPTTVLDVDGAALTGRTITYQASDPGGWFTLDAAEPKAPLPWAGPMHPIVKPLRLRLQQKADVVRGSRTPDPEDEATLWTGLALPALSFSIVELSH